MIKLMGLREIRKSRGLTQRDLAEMIGMDHAQVQRAESHKPTAKLATFIKLAEVLDVPLADLFTDEMTPQERDALTAFRNLPESRRGEWLQVLRLAAARDGQAPPSTSPGDPD